MRALESGRRIMLAAALVAAPAAAAAQERLVGLRTASVGFFAESYDFGDGLVQRASVAGTAGGASIIKSATQWVIPVSLMVPIGERWTADVATIVTHGEAKFVSGPGPGTATARLSGIGDVRLRASGRLVGERLLLTVGANLASGVRELSAGQIAALGVFAAPAVGSVSPAASAGPSVTTGLVYAMRRAGWAWAAGAGVEVRGNYSPVAALTAGVPTPTFDPGTALHLSLGTNGFVGDGSLSVALTADVYTQDRLSAGPTSGPVAAAATVKLGPTIGGELQWRPGTTRLRELVFYAAERYRASFTRDGESVDGTSASYANAGVRAAYPLGPLTSLTSSVDVWNHTGLSIDQSLVTAKTTSGAITFGLARRFGMYTLQPYARARVGTIDTGVGSASVTGVGAGINFGARF